MPKSARSAKFGGWRSLQQSPLVVSKASVGPARQTWTASSRPAAWQSRAGRIRHARLRHRRADLDDRLLHRCLTFPARMKQGSAAIRPVASWWSRCCRNPGMMVATAQSSAVAQREFDRGGQTLLPKAGAGRGPMALARDIARCPHRGAVAEHVKGDCRDYRLLFGIERHGAGRDRERGGRISPDALNSTPS